MKTDKKLNLVLEGGGVKGIGLVGAIEQFESAGYSWAHIGGSSAGAIVATLLAVGYTGEELKIHVMNNLDFSDMMDDATTRRNFLKVSEVITTKSLWHLVFRIPQILGLYKKLNKDNGLFSGDFIEEYVKALIEKKTGKKDFTFGDLQKGSDLSSSKLNLMVTDISNRRLLILPRDSEKLGIQPNDLKLVDAVRMSMSFPFFFTPVKTSTAWIMDGGILSNFPYWYIDGLDDVYPTVGFLLDEIVDGPIKDIKSMATGLLNTMISPLDQAFSIYKQRVVKISVEDISTLDFQLGGSKKEKLYLNGSNAAENFLAGFNYKAATEEYLWKGWGGSTFMK